LNKFSDDKLKHHTGDGVHLMVIEIILVIVGLGGIWYGTDLVIRNAVAVADMFGLSQMFVGITILAIGTDLPEFVISLNASLEKLNSGADTSGLIIGNAIGSAFAQISLVLGITGLAGYIIIRKSILYTNGIMLLGSVVMLGVFAFDGTVNRFEGLALVVTYLVYYFKLLKQEGVKQKLKEKPGREIWQKLLLLAAGIALVMVASEVVVDHSVKLSAQLGVAQSFIGIVLIGLGTSLPELAISIRAVAKKAHSLSVGNILGSNIFDVLIPVGMGSAIAGVNIKRSLVVFDISFLFILTAVVLFFFYRRKGLQQVEAVILIGIYILYAALKFAGV
jgi:cation:H+ antiporter